MTLKNKELLTILFGSNDQFDRMYRDHFEGLQRIANLKVSPKLRSQIEIHDVVQDAYIKAFTSKGVPDFKNAKEEFKWLSTILTNTIIDFARKIKDQDNGIQIEEVESSNPSVYQKILRKERLVRLRAAVEKLPQRQRDAILYTKVDGLTVDKTAAKMDTTNSSVVSLIFRAIKTLRKTFPHTDSLSLPSWSLSDSSL